MQRIKHETELLVYDELAELPPADRALVEASIRAAATSYSPYSNFKVGAAIRLADGTVVQGSNQENAAFPSGLCAEQVAVSAAAAQHPGVAMEAIAIYAPGHLQEAVPLSPCGNCRQVLYQHEWRQKRPLRLFLKGKASQVYSLESVRGLLPFPFEL